MLNCVCVCVVCFQGGPGPKGHPGFPGEEGTAVSITFPNYYKLFTIHTIISTPPPCLLSQIKHIKHTYTWQCIHVHLEYRVIHMLTAIHTFRAYISFSFIVFYTQLIFSFFSLFVLGSALKQTFFFCQTEGVLIGKNLKTLYLTAGRLE